MIHKFFCVGKKICSPQGETKLQQPQSKSAIIFHGRWCVAVSLRPRHPNQDTLLHVVGKQPRRYLCAKLSRLTAHPDAMGVGKRFQR
jgi:hypothetical protein